MAEARAISVKILLEREKEFKSALQGCFAEIEKARAQLKLTDSEYKGNSNSVEALTAKVNALNQVYTAQANYAGTVQKIIDSLKSTQDNYSYSIDETRNKIAANNEQIERLSANEAQNAEEIKRLRDENEKLNGYLNTNQQGYDRVSKSIEDYNARLVKAKTFQNNANFELKQYQGYLDEARNSTDGCATSIDRFGRTVKQVGDQTQQMGQTASKAIVNFAQVLAMSRINATVQKIAGALEDCTESARDFESAMALIEKTLGDKATPEGMARLRDEIISLSYELPKSATEIASVAQSAAQLGIAQENVLAFAKTMIMLGDASTDLDAEGASQRLAKFATVTKTTADEYNRLGSTVMKLGNSFATTEDQLTTMATKMAGVGSVAGLTQPQILALAAAASSVGVEAAAGSTSLSKIIRQIQTAVVTGEKLSDFAKVAGMSAEEFRRAWGDNAVKAIADFIAGLGNMDKQSGAAIITLNNLGITNDRVVKTITSLANNSELLYQTIETSDTAWAENNALQQAAGVIYDTTEAKTQRLKNAMEGLKIAVGDQLNPVLGDLAEMGTNILEPVTQFVNDNPAIVAAISAIVVGLGVLTAALTAAAIAIKAVDMAAEALEDHPYIKAISLALGAIVALTTAISTLAAINGEARESFNDLMEGTEQAEQAFKNAADTYNKTANAIEPTVDAVYRYIDELKGLESQSSMTTEEQERYRIVVGAINGLIPEINAQIDEQTGLLAGGTDALEANTQKWKENALEQAKSAALAGKMQALIEAQAEGMTLAAKAADYQTKIAAGEAQLDAMAVRAARSLGYQAESYEELVRIGKQHIGVADETTSLDRELIETYQDVSENLDIYRANLDTVNESIARNNETVDEMQSSYDSTVKYIDQMSESEIEAVEATEDLTAAQENAIDNIADLVAAYDEAYEAALKSIDSQVDVFDRLGGKSKKTADEILKNMKVNADFLNEFGDAYQHLIDMGYNTEFLQQFEDINPDNLAILKDLASETPDEVNKLWESFEDAKGKVAAPMADAKVELSKKTAEMTADVKRLAGDMREGTTEAGKNFADGFVSGLNRKLGAISAAGSQAGKVALAAMKRALNSNSPSKETIKIGGDFGGGFAIGMNQTLEQIEATTRAMGNIAVSSLNRSVNGLRASSPSGQIGATAVDASGITSAMRESIGNINITPEVTVNFDYREFGRGLAQYES